MINFKIPHKIENKDSNTYRNGLLLVSPTFSLNTYTFIILIFKKKNYCLPAEER